jgi:hypothetical protein
VIKYIQCIGKLIEKLKYDLLENWEMQQNLKDKIRRHGIELKEIDPYL